MVTGYFGFQAICPRRYLSNSETYFGRTCPDHVDGEQTSKKIEKEVAQIGHDHGEAVTKRAGESGEQSC
jgi:hypothetical protein